MKRVPLLVVAALLGLFVGIALGDDSGELAESKARALDANARADVANHTADSVTAELLRLERIHQDSIQELELVRAQVVQLRRRPQARVDSLVRLVPDSLGLEVAIEEERGYWREEIGALEAIIQEERGISAALRESLEATHEAWMAEQARGDRWESYAGELEGEVQKWRGLAIGAAILTLASWILR